jgi:hypothetical protein
MRSFSFFRSVLYSGLVLSPPHPTRLASNSSYFSPFLRWAICWTISEAQRGSTAKWPRS